MPQRAFTWSKWLEISLNKCKPILAVRYGSDWSVTPACLIHNCFPFFSDQKHERESFAWRKNKMAELIQKLTTLVCLFSRHVLVREEEMLNLIKVHYVNAVFLYLDCFILSCGTHDYVFYFAWRRMREIKKLSTDQSKYIVHLSYINLISLHKQLKIKIALVEHKFKGKDVFLSVYGNYAENSPLKFTCLIFMGSSNSPLYKRSSSIKLNGVCPFRFLPIF